MDTTPTRQHFCLPLLETMPGWHASCALGIAPWAEYVTDKPISASPITQRELDCYDPAMPTYIPTFERKPKSLGTSHQPDMNPTCTTQDTPQSTADLSLPTENPLTIKSPIATSHDNSVAFAKGGFASIDRSRPAWIASSNGIEAGSIFLTQEADMCLKFHTEDGFNSNISRASDNCEDKEAEGAALWTLPEATTDGPEQVQGLGEGWDQPHTTVPEGNTTLMVQNLARGLSRKAFMDLLDSRGFAGLYDFVHIPGIFGTGKNKGFAFVNFIDEQAAITFTRRFAPPRAAETSKAVPGQAGWRVVPAAVQGLEANTKKASSRKMRRVRDGSHRPLFLAWRGKSISF